MSFSPDQLNLLQTAATTSSALSLVGSMYLLVAIWTKNHSIETTSSNERLLFVMSIVSIIGSCAFGQGQFTFQQPALCLVQASLVEFTVNALPLLGLTQAINFYLILSGKQKPILYDFLMIFLSLLIPTGLVLYGLSAGLFGPAVNWCWITKVYVKERYFLFYVLLWINIVLVFVFTSLGVKQVFNTEKKISCKSSSKTKFKYTANACKSFVYAAVFIITGIPGTTNRLYETLYGHSPFILSFVHAMVTPLEGFLNAAVYMILNNYLGSQGSLSSSDRTLTKPSILDLEKADRL